MVPELDLMAKSQPWPGRTYALEPLIRWTCSGIPDRPQQITFAEMREQGVRGVVVGAMMSVDLSQGQAD